MTSPREQGQWLPVASLLFSATLWGLLWLPLRWLDAHGLRGLWVTVIIFGIPMCLGLPLLYRHRRELAAYPVLLTVSALANGWCNTAFIVAVIHGNVVRVLLLFYLSPLWAVLLARWMVGEALNRQARITLWLAVAGAVLMLWDPARDLPWPREAADWLAISSGFGFALSNVVVRRLQTVAVTVKTAVSWCGVTAVAGLWLAATAVPAPPAAAGPLAVAAALGLFGITVMSLSVLYGVTRMPVHRSAVILLFELVAGTASSQLLTNEVVNTREWIGGALILSAAWFAARAHLRRDEVTDGAAGPIGDGARHRP